MIDRVTKHCKVLIVGFEGVGKSTFILKQEGFVEHNLVSYFTNVSEKFIFECTEARDFTEVDPAHFDATIVMCDSQSEESFKHALNLRKKLIEKNLVFSVCCSKVDIKKRKVYISDFLKLNVDFVDISSKTRYQISYPFLIIVRKLSSEAMSRVYFVENV